MLLRSAFLPGSSQEAETLHPGWGQCVHFPRASEEGSGGAGGRGARASHWEAGPSLAGAAHC